MTERAELFNRLDQLGVQWCVLAPNNNEAQRKSLELEIWNLIYRLYDKPEQIELIGELYINEWHKFNSSLGSLSSFISFRLRSRELDSIRRQISTAKRTVSLEELESDSDGGAEKPSWQIPDRNADEEMRSAENTASFVSLLSLIIDLPDRLHGRAKNPIRLMYYRLFFTDAVINILRSAPDSALYDSHERDIFTAMWLRFLDWLMEKRCRTVEELANSNIRPYGDLADGHSPTEPPKQPLPNDVYTCYLERMENYTVSQSAVTIQHVEFRKFLKEYMC